MTTRVLQLKPSLDIPASASRKVAFASTASIENKNSLTTTVERPSVGDVPNVDLNGDASHEQAGTSSAATDDKFALCEVSDLPIEQHSALEAPHDPGVKAEAPLPNPEPSTENRLQLAIERCTALGEKLDAMVNEKWGKRSAPILKECLDFLSTYQAATKEEQQASRKAIKAASGVSREPNLDNLAVIAVYMCVSCSDKTRTEEQRKGWCRFATVVKVAVLASVKPEHAPNWLEKKTLNGILAEWSEHKKAKGKTARKTSVPKALKEYKHLAAALEESSTFQSLAKSELAKVDAAIATAMAEAANEPAAPEVPLAGDVEAGFFDVEAQS